MDNHYRIHVYPIMRQAVEVEAPNPKEAARTFNKMKLGVRASGSSGKLLKFHFRYLPF